MFKRYDLTVYCDDNSVYSASFSSINLLVRFACGFNDCFCNVVAFDVVTEKYLPIEELMDVFRGDVNGI